MMRVIIIAVAMATAFAKTTDRAAIRKEWRDYSKWRVNIKAENKIVQKLAEERHQQKKLSDKITGLMKENKLEEVKVADLTEQNTGMTAQLKKAKIDTAKQVKQIATLSKNITSKDYIIVGLKNQTIEQEANNAQLQEQATKHVAKIAEQELRITELEKESEEEAIEIVQLSELAAENKETINE